MRLIHKISILVVAVTVCCAVSLSFVLYGVARGIITDQVLKRLTAAAEGVEKRIIDKTQRYHEWVNLLSSRTQLRTNLEKFASSEGKQKEAAAKRIQEIIKNAKKVNQPIESIEVYTTDGTLVATTEEASNVVELNENTLIRDINPNLSLRLQPESNLRFVLRAGLFVDGEKLGQLVCRLNPMHVADLLNEPLGLGDSERITISERINEREARILFSSAGERKATGTEYPHVVQISDDAPMMRGFYGVEYAAGNVKDYRGEEVFAASRIIESLNWALVLKVDSNEAIAPLQRFQKALYWFMAIALLVSLIPSYWFSRSIARPIVKLLSGVSAIRDGNLGYRVDSAGDWELRQLGDAFNSMAEELAGSYRRIQTVLKNLRAAERHMKAVLDSSIDAVISIDTEGAVLYWNPAAERIFGYCAEDLQGRPLVDYVVPPRYREPLRASLAACARGEDGGLLNRRIRSRGLHRSGLEIPIELISSMIDEGNRPVITGFIRDLTGEEAAIENRLRLASIVESTDDSIVAKNMEGTIIAWNKAAERIYGYTSEEAVGKPESLIVPRDRLGEENEIFKKIAAGEHLSGLETERVCKDGRRIQISLTVSPLKNDTGEIIAVSAISRDITERKEQQRQILASLREKEIMLKEIHHRVKNNLQVISSLLSLQSSFLEDEEIQSCFKTSEQRVQSMALVHERLYQSERLSQVDFSSYIEQLVSDLFRNYSVDSTDINLITNIEPIELSIEDAIPCGLLVNELISNCLKHAFSDRQQGTIQVDFVEDGNHIVLIVADDGRGMPDDIDLEHPTTLGIELVRTLADQLEGELEWIRSEGTKVRIRFLRTGDTTSEEYSNGRCEHISM